MFSEKDGPWHCLSDHCVVIRMGNEAEWTGKIKPVYDSGEGPTVYDISVGLSTAEENAARGSVCPARYMVSITPPLELESRTPESWNIPTPTSEDREFAEKTWGAHLKGIEGDYEKACELSRLLCHELWPHTGWPIDELTYYTPFDSYRAMIAGKSKGFCVQFNIIFVHACKCFGVIARNMHMERPIRYTPESWVLLGGMHTTAEIFDRARNRWIFMDIRFYCQGVYIGEEGPLNTAEFHLFMSQPHWRDRLKLQVYNMTTKTESRLPFKECPRPDIHFYSGWSTVFHVGKG
ncbi:MAG: hypothetical protein ABIP97_05855 [Chthoniobacterales bacterium]